MKKILLTLMFCLAITGNVFAVGLDFTEVGLRANAMGTAYTGIADDASAVYWNPAGLTQIDNETISGEIMLAYIRPTHTYEDTSGKSYDNSASIFIPEGFIAYKRGDFAVATGLYIPYANGSSDFKNVPYVYPGLGVATTANIKAVMAFYALGASLAYRVLPALSIGLTGEAIYGVNELEVSLDNPLSPGTNGMTQDLKTRGWAGYRAAVGIMIEPTQDLNIGLQFKNKTDLSMQGTYYIREVNSGTIIYDNNAEFKEKLPYVVMGGVGYNVTSVFIISLDSAYKWWSEADKKTLEYEVSGTKIKQNATYKQKNNYSVAIGIEYKPIETLKLRSGIFYISAAADDENVSYLNDIDTSVISLRGGVAYNLLPKLEICGDLAYSYGTGSLGAENDSGKYGATAWTALIGLRYSK